MTKEEQQKLMEKKVIEVADYAIEQMNEGNNPSTRTIAADLTKAFNDKQVGKEPKKGVPTFKVSNCTVCVYLSQRLPKLDPIRYKLVKPMIEKNTPKSIKDVEVLQRMYEAVELLLKGLNIPQIVEELNGKREDDDKVTFDIIYYDLTVRLNKVETNQAILNDVKRRLTENRLDMLNNQGVNGPNMNAINQARDSKGKFVLRHKWTKEQVDNISQAMIFGNQTFEEAIKSYGITNSTLTEMLNSGFLEKNIINLLVNINSANKKGITTTEYLKSQGINLQSPDESNVSVGKKKK